MSRTVTLIGVCVIIAVITWVVKRRSPARSNHARHAVGRAAVHLPSEDPYWLEHSQRQAQRPRGAQPRRKIWAAGTAGAVGAGTTDPGGGCGGGSSAGGSDWDDGGSSCGGGD